MKTLTKFYQIQNPTTKRIFDAIINQEYTPLESIKPKAKQIKTLLLNEWNCNDIFVTFGSVTNCGGVPIFFSSDVNLYTIATEQQGFYDMTEDEQNNLIELLGAYCTTFDKIFN